MNESDIRNTALKVLKTIAPEIGDDDIRGEKTLRSQVDLDSMDWLNFLLGLNRELGVDIPEADYAKLVTMNDVVAYLKAKLS